MTTIYLLNNAAIDLNLGISSKSYVLPTEEKKEDLPYKLNKALFGERIREIRKDRGDNQPDGVIGKTPPTSAMLALGRKGVISPAFRYSL